MSRLGAGCSAARVGPDVRAGGRMFGLELAKLLLLSGVLGPDFRAGAECLGGGWMFGSWDFAEAALLRLLLGWGAGYPGQGLDVRPL